MSQETGRGSPTSRNLLLGLALAGLAGLAYAAILLRWLHIGGH